MKQFIDELKRNYKVVIKRIVFLLSIALTSGIYELLNNFRGNVYHIPTQLDSAIPFNKYFIIFYVFWYIYIGAAFAFYIVRDESKYFKLLWGINLGMLICFVIYYFFPTIVPRPEVYGKDVFAYMVRAIYGRDNPYNCFPSIHVFDSFLVAIYINRDTKFSYKIKLLSSISAFMITLSTLYIKQHYIYDAVAGAILAYAIYVAFNYKELASKLVLRKNSILTEGNEK